MQMRKLGTNGPLVSALGLGCMGMSVSYGVPDDPESIATIRRAIDLGINLIVTSDAYGAGVNETLVGKALAGWRERVLVGTKFGNVGQGGRVPDGLSPGHPDYVKMACEASLERLGIDAIDIYGLHRVDPRIPIEDTVGAMKRLVEQGKVRYLLLSEAGPQTIRRAHQVHPITVVETEYSLWSRDAETDILPTCRELGIGFNAYAPLGRGFLTATIKSLDVLGAHDRRREHPRFAASNLAHNVQLLASLEAIAAARGFTPAQIALAWLLGRGPDVVPIPGTKHRTYLEQNAAAAAIELGADEVQRLDQAFPAGIAAGARYPEKQLRTLGL